MRERKSVPIKDMCRTKCKIKREKTAPERHFYSCSSITKGNWIGIQFGFCNSGFGPFSRFLANASWWLWIKAEDLLQIYIHYQHLR